MRKEALQIQQSNERIYIGKKFENLIYDPRTNTNQRLVKVIN